MLARLRRRFILIIMALVGLVLLVVLAASVISSYRSDALRIEQALSAAIGHGPESEQRPGVGRPGSGPDNQSAPVYIANVDLENSLILEDNSLFIHIDSALAGEALDRIKEKVLSQGGAETRPTTGLFLDQGLFYRVAFESDGSVTIALADASSLITRTIQMTVFSALIWLGAMIAFFFISLWLSKLALRPTVEAWMRQRRFIADASHELKTPLTVILANNSLLLAHPEKTVADQERWVLSTQEEAQRMDGLVHDLLLLAQTDEAADKDGILGGGGSPEPDKAFSSVDFSALVNRNLLQFEAVFFERDIALQTEIAEGIGIEGDEEQLNRLLLILLDNASKYATREVSVTLTRGAAANRQAVLKVSNTGDVIAPEILPHLFERFYRGDAAHSDAEGSGLGLSLAQAIVETHHGSITATSTVDAGTVFTVSL